MKKFIKSVLLLCLIVCMGCSQEERKVEEMPIPVKTIRVEKRDLKEVLSFVGDIKAEDEAEAYPKIPGKLIKYKVKEGDKVKKNEVLAFIDRDEPGFKFEASPVEAPISGIVGRVYLDRGTWVNIQTPIALILKADVVKVRINIIERDLPRVKIGQRAEVKIDAWPDKIFMGKLEKISPLVDRFSRTSLAEVKIPNLHRHLVSGMFGRIRLIVKEARQVSSINRDALIEEDGCQFVFLVKEGIASKTKVILGISEGNCVEVIEGVGSGEEIVIMGQKELKEGSKVDIVP